MKIEISTGELVDKVTILEIKLDRMTDSAKLKNVRHEYQLLEQALKASGFTRDSDEFCRLKAVNIRLWEIEDRLRGKERAKQFDAEFIELARTVYLANDERSLIKRQINLRAGSTIVEEKEHIDYTTPDGG